MLIVVLGVATLLGAFVFVQRAGSGTLDAAGSPDWLLLTFGFLIYGGVQPLRAWAWSSTVRSPVGFRAIYASSSIGSFLDTVLPGRLGEASKVAVLKVASGSRWPGFSRAGGSLLCAHLLEMIAFALVGAGAAFFLPVPVWARWTAVFGLAAAAGGIVLAVTLHRRVERRLPRFGAFLGGAAAPRVVLLQAGGILLATWIARWFGVLFCLQAFGIHLGLGAALLYMIVTGLANTAPILPGNLGIYQGAAVGALALAGFSGGHALAASLLAPVVFSFATGVAALAGIALYGRRFMELPRAALARPAA